MEGNRRSQYDFILTDNFHVVSGLECDILIVVNELSGCDLADTTDGVKIKDLSKEENVKGETTVHCCRHIKAFRKSDDNLWVSNVTYEDAIMKVTERSQREKSNSMGKKKNERKNEVSLLVRMSELKEKLKQYACENENKNEMMKVEKWKKHDRRKYYWRRKCK